MSKKYLICGLLILLLSGLATSASVGAAPGFLDMGEIEKGETVEHTMYITTNFDQSFVIQPSPTEGSTSRMFRESNELRNETSGEDISDWIEVTDEVGVSPNETDTYELPDGTAVTANGRFTFELTVPSDADPGYHYGGFRLNPQIDSGENGAGTVNWGETRPRFRFKVPGRAERGIEVNDVNGIRVGENRVQIIQQVRNTGTVTAELQRGNLDVIDEDTGEKVGEVILESTKLQPGEIAEIETFWGSEDLEGGNYRIEGIGDYRTGETYISGGFAITSGIQERQEVNSPASETAGEGKEGIPYTLIIVAMLLTGTLLYLLDLSALWLLILTSLAGISLFVVLSSAPSYLVLILLTAVGVIIYYGGI